MTMFATGRQVPEPSLTPLSDRIAAGFAALPGAESGADTSPYWTTSLNRPTGFVPVDLGGTTPERVAHGLLLALASLPVGVALAFTTGRSGPLIVVAAVGLGLCAALLYRLGARTISRRGAAAVSAVVLVGVLLETVAAAASETSVAGDRGSGPLGFGVAVVHRLGDPAQTGRHVAATALLLFVGLTVTAGTLVGLGSVGKNAESGTDTPQGLSPTDEQTPDGAHDAEAAADATDE
ncbi:MAG: hypothetical protein M3Y71_10845 [Actinomycetota bacterium]|nr:hypothetical protein [Actinomycetota bacterium]